jgi:hypothetical protein
MNANGLVRCTEARTTEAWTMNAPATALHLRALPGVAEAEHREGRLWVRFQGRDQRATGPADEALTGRRPQARTGRRRGNGRRPPQGTPPREGDAA